MKVYYAKIDGFLEEEMETAMQLLPKERVERMERVKQIKVRQQSISAGLLLEYALRMQGLEGRKLTFQKNKDGKPFIVEYPDYHYNLSHSSEYVALVVDENPVGVDVEGLRIGRQKVVERFFSEEEKMLLKNDWSDELFTKIWTRKESYIKATGYGMRMPLEGFSTLEEKVQINEKMYHEMVEMNESYYLASMCLAENHWLSVCRKAKPVLDENGDFSAELVDLKWILKKV